MTLRQPLRVVVGQPVVGHVPPDAYQSQMVAFHDASASGIVTGFCFANHTYIDKARQDIVLQARAMDATHIMWVDADMILPRDAITTLVGHGKQIVGGLYHKRKAPFEPVAFDWGEPFGPISVVKEEGLQEVGALGFGCTLTAMDVFDRMDYPWFVSTWPKNGAGEWYFLGEDIFFFEKVRDLNVPVWLDTDVKCGHVTDRTVTHADWLNHKDEM